ncbi:MAG TPA: DUF4230 domain-containing protein [Chryseolinea sp.]
MFTDRKLVLIVISLIVVTVTAYMLFVFIPARIAQQTYDGAKQIGQDIANAFNVTPQIKVNNTIILQQQTPILELATVSQKFEHRYGWVNTWLGSTKKIDIRGTFEAKAGFDLNQKFSIDIEGNNATVTLPKPKLLSIEPQNDVTFRDENGVWNWVDAEDRAKAMNAFTRDARRYGEQGKLIEQARLEMETKLREILLLHEKHVEIRYANERIERL